jgi:hypothetical protein
MDLLKYKRGAKSRKVTFTLYLPIEAVEELKKIDQSEGITSRTWLADDVVNHSLPKLRKAIQSKKESA